jgi:hypothetical protein
VEGVGTCQKLGGGHLTAPRQDAADLANFLDWFLAETVRPGVPGDKCESIWTPYNDNAKEGEWVSLVDGSKATFLPWSPAEGDKEDRKANSILIYMPSRPKSYTDEEDLPFQYKKPVCISCTLPSNLTVNLIGLCADSTLGKAVH